RVVLCRILPHILLPGKAEGVSTEFHRKALVLCEVAWVGICWSQSPCRIIVLRILRL
ncbi:hypothetical protein F4604DRAFT_1583230, partial [Suillus subluteus]